MASKNNRLRKPILLHRNRAQPATAAVLSGRKPLKRMRQKPRSVQWL